MRRQTQEKVLLLNGAMFKFNVTLNVKGKVHVKRYILGKSWIKVTILVTLIIYDTCVKWV